jgi:hypothetical protein
MALAPGEENWLGLIARLGAGLCPELFDLGDLHRPDLPATQHRPTHHRLR